MAVLLSFSLVSRAPETGPGLSVAEDQPAPSRHAGRCRILSHIDEYVTRRDLAESLTRRLVLKSQGRSVRLAIYHGSQGWLLFAAGRWHGVPRNLIWTTGSKTPSRPCTFGTRAPPSWPIIGMGAGK